MRRTLVLVLCAAAALALAPAGNAAAPDDGLPDRWSGAWPAQLMPDAMQLGTLTWRPITYEEGRAYLGRAFGGLAFEGCPADGGRGSSAASTTSAATSSAARSANDARTLVGRFNGNETLRSGSFTITLIREGDEPLFFGQYFEDHGVTTDWCGVLEAGSRPPEVTATRRRRSSTCSPPGGSGEPRRALPAYDEAEVRVEV